MEFSVEYSITKMFDSYSPRLNKIRIESARVRGSNKDGRDVFLAVI